jgi:hypothetical protein
VLVVVVSGNRLPSRTHRSSIWEKHVPKPQLAPCTDTTHVLKRKGLDKKMMGVIHLHLVLAVDRSVRAASFSRLH